MFKIGLCQVLVHTSKQTNLAHAKTLVEQAVLKGAQLVSLPVRFSPSLILGMLQLPVQHRMFPRVCGTRSRSVFRDFY